MLAIKPKPEILERGMMKRMGHYGPVYELTGQTSVDNSGQVFAEIILLETGEQTEVRLENALADLKA